MKAINVNFVKISWMERSYSGDIMNCPYMIPFELEKPIQLGLTKHVSFNKHKKISYRIDKVSSSTYKYEISDDGLIIETYKKTNESEILEKEITFKVTPFTKFVFPKTDKYTPKLFGLDNIYDQVKSVLIKKELFMTCLFGPVGCGKHSLLSKIEYDMEEKHFIWLDKYKTNESFIRLCDIVRALSNDVVLCIPDVDLINNEKLNAFLMATLFDTLKEDEYSHIMVVITCTDIKTLHPYIREHVSLPIAVNPLNNHDKYLYLTHLLPMAAEGLETFAKSLHGYSASDIKSFVGEVRKKHGDNLTLQQLQEGKANKIYQPRHLADVIANFESLKWSDIGGYEDVKRRMIEDIQEPIMNGGIMAKGILLHGPPGCSKTMFARALATECGLNMFIVTASNVLRSVVGESEAILKKILRVAKQSEPSMVFIDEIDILLPSRQRKTNSPVTDRLLAELMLFFDGIETMSDHRVFLMAATNKLDCLDEALIRPGRIDLIIEISLPDEAARQSILRLVFADKEYRVEDDVVETIPELASFLVGQSGADIVEGGHEMKRLAQNECDGSGGECVPVLRSSHVTRVFGYTRDNDLAQQLASMSMK